MTIGIAIVCDSGNSILLSCDQRASYGYPPNVNDGCGKLFSLANGKLYAIVAGDVNTCQMIDGYLAENLKDVQDTDLSLDSVKNAMQDARTQASDVLRDERLRRELAISLRQFHTDDGLSPSIRREAKNIISATEPEAALIVAGFAKRGGIVLSLFGNQDVQETTTPGFHLIGSGAALAQLWLNFRKQNVHMSAARSYYHVREAMLFAALDPSVSSDSVCIAIRPGGMFKLERAQEYANAIGGRFYLRPTEELDANSEIEDFKAAFGISQSWG